MPLQSLHSELYSIASMFLLNVRSRQINRAINERVRLRIEAGSTGLGPYVLPRSELRRHNRACAMKPVLGNREMVNRELVNKEMKSLIQP